METALAGAKEEEGNLLIIQPEKEKKCGGREESFCTEKPNDAHYEAAMKDELFRERSGAV